MNLLSALCEHVRGVSGQTKRHARSAALGGCRRIPRARRCARGRARTPATDGGLDDTLASYHETVKVALVHLDVTNQSARVIDAIRATAATTATDIADMEEDLGPPRH
jgi:hypothetical protein